MALKVIELIVDDSLTGDTRVEEIALVLQPAIETEFMWFNRQPFAEIGERGGIKESDKAPKSDTPNRNPQGEGTAKGDASSTRGAEVTARVEEILKGKADDFNERYKDKLGYGVNVGMLKSVYQRGVGAYNVSHSPAVKSAEQWALARVNAFLYLVKNGRPENSKYVGDNDLLPNEHPKKEKMSEQFETYNDYPKAASENACKVLRWREEHGDEVKGMTQVGWTRANQLCKGENISEETIARMSAFQRHKQNSEIAPEFEGTPWKDAGYVAWLGWGGTEGVEWAQRKLQTIREEMEINTGNLQPWSKTDGETIISGDTDMCGCGGGYYQMENGVYPIGQIQKDSLISGYDCGCGCPDMDGCGYDDSGLYFGTTMINGMPVFESQEEAEGYAEQLGCEGSHVHVIDGKEYYMPCEIHNPELVDKVADLIEDRGVELEDLLEQGWEIVDAEPLDEMASKEITRKMASKFNKIKPEEFVQIITTPGEPSVQDLGNKRFRYVYSTGFGPDLIATSRQMCRRMLGGRQFVFRYEDIVALSAALDSDPDTYKLVPRPKGTSVDAFTYKMGANCRHYWTQLVFQPNMASIIAEQTPQPKITNNARRMLEQADVALPAPNQAGSVNPPVDYGSRSPESVGFTKASSQVIIVDMDDTLVRGNTPIKKTIDYVNRKAKDYRIVIVSGRQAARTEETKRHLNELGVLWDDIYLSDFPQGPNASNAFKEYKAKWLMDKGFKVVEAIENNSDARRLYSNLGIKAVSPTSLKAIPKGFLQGLPIYETMEEAKEHSENMGCSGMIEEVVYLGKKMFQACGYNMNKNKMSAQFSVDEEKRMLYSPAMKPGILIPRVDEVTREKYFVTFKPETIERMAQRFLIEKRTDKTNYEHSNQKFDGVYLVESWIVDGDQDKAYALGYGKNEIPKGTWMVGYRIDNDQVWDMIKKGKVKGLSIEGNFEYKFSVEENDEYLLKEIINILNQINQ